MSPRFSLLAEIDAPQLRAQSLQQVLRRSGVNVLACTPPPVLCLRFQLTCAGGGMICLVDANAWAAVHLPGLVGLDWSLMDPLVLAGLVAVERPLQFADDVLGYDHARALPTTTLPSRLTALPTVVAVEGEVWIESRSAPLPPAPRLQPLPAGLALPIHLRLGKVMLTPQRMRRLRGGDIVLLPAPVLRAWRGACPLFDFQLHPDSLTVTTVHSPFNSDLNAPDTTPHADADHPSLEMTDLDDLPLELNVLLCRIDMRLGELAGLQEGSIVTLPERVSQHVELVHNGRRLVAGELVQVGDRLGVKLAQVPRLA